MEALSSSNPFNSEIFVHFPHCCFPGSPLVHVEAEKGQPALDRPGTDGRPLCPQLRCTAGHTALALAGAPPFLASTVASAQQLGSDSRPNMEPQPQASPTCRPRAQTSAAALPALQPTHNADGETLHMGKGQIGREGHATNTTQHRHGLQETQEADARLNNEECQASSPRAVPYFPGGTRTKS